MIKITIVDTQCEIEVDTIEEAVELFHELRRQKLNAYQRECYQRRIAKQYLFQITNIHWDIDKPKEH